MEPHANKGEDLLFSSRSFAKRSECCCFFDMPIGLQTRAIGLVGHRISSVLKPQKAINDGQLRFSMRGMVNPLPLEEGGKKPPTAQVKQAVESGINQLESVILAKHPLDCDLVPKRIWIKQGGLKHRRNLLTRAKNKNPAIQTSRWLIHDAANLAKITPSHMGFNIISKHHGDKMYAGQIIEYTVKPLLGIPLYWMTEITHVQEGAYFVDEQRFGPYTMWHHQHHFKEVSGGVMMVDIVHYKIPLGFLGDIAHWLFVKKQLQGIFDFRFKAVIAKWGK